MEVLHSTEMFIKRNWISMDCPVLVKYWNGSICNYVRRYSYTLEYNCKLFSRALQEFCAFINCIISTKRISYVKKSNGNLIFAVKTNCHWPEQLFLAGKVANGYFFDLGEVRPEKNLSQHYEYKFEICQILT